jgi:site-specific DNA-methyltransferase (adenine-specific)
VSVRFGRWQDVLADVESCDLLCVDAPYSAKTHKGHDSGSTPAKDGAERASLHYAAWGETEISEFVGSWSPRTRGWFVTITDTVLAPIWSAHLESQGRYVFSPLAFVDPGSRVRMTGDGPAQWSCWVVVARPRTPEFAKWGSLPGAYVLPKGVGAQGKNVVMGGKPLWLLRALVRDYSRPGDLVVDPCAGGCTALLAAQIEGRCALGAEQMESHFRIGSERLAHGFTPNMFAGMGDT